MNNEIEKRLVTLEISMAHIEKQFDELNQVIISQGRLINKLQSSQQELLDHNHRKMLEEMKGQIKKPPHAAG